MFLLLYLLIFLVFLKEDLKPHIESLLNSWWSSRGGGGGKAEEKEKGRAVERKRDWQSNSHGMNISV